MTNRGVAFFVAIFAALFSPNLLADCLGAGYSRGNDPCDTKRASRQNSFGDHNVYQPPKSREQELAEQRRLTEGRAIHERSAKLAAEIDAKKAAEEESIRKQKAYEREVAMRQAEIYARHRQAEATEAAAKAAARAAESAADAAAAASQAAASKPPPPQTMNCYSRGGGRSTCY
jgi:hypothetical protein